MLSQALLKHSSLHLVQFISRNKPFACPQVEVGRADAASAAASGGLSALSVGSDMLTPLINRAKHQLEVERARGGLHKAMAAAKTSADLPQLDAAIQAAHKAGLQDRVTEASRCRRCHSQLHPSLSHC